MIPGDLRSFYDCTKDDLLALFESVGQPKYRVDQLLRWLYRRRETRWENMSDLPEGLRQTLAASLPLSLPEVANTAGAKDSTLKFLFRFSDGSMVESVLIPPSPALYGSLSKRKTLCLSTQVGCAYGCKFCASGLDGWKRNLSAGEIVGQFLAAEAASGEKINNIVFMGMGEPLANFAAVMKSIDILNSPWGADLGARHITVSTSGLVPEILKLADQPRQIRLAVSLHGATDEVRDQIMPVNRKYPLDSLLRACTYYANQKKQKLSFEYILIAGINDRPSDSRALAQIARSLHAKINLIPYNPVEGLPWQRSSDSSQQNFLETLRKNGVVATLRREKGGDIAAACGQLRMKTLAGTNEISSPSPSRED